MILLITILTSLFHLINACPSSKWVICAVDGQTCTIPSTVNSTTIAYGDDSNQIWTFLEIRNELSSSGDTQLSISCSKDTFGIVDSGGSNIECCLSPYTENPLSVPDEFNQESHWTLAGNADDPTFDLPASKIDGKLGYYARWVRYGLNGQYTYRLFNYQVDCDASLFGDPTGNSGNMCWYLDTVYNIGNGSSGGGSGNGSSGDSNDWILCGMSTDGECNLEVDTTNTDIMRLVKYGQYNTSEFAYHDQFYYRFVYAYGGSVPCNDDFFGAVGTGDTMFCYVAAVGVSNYFVNPVGYWQLVSYCSDCTITKSLEYGVTSTSEDATTSTWSEQVTKTVSAGMKFSFLSVGHEVSQEVSESVASTMSDTFEVSVTMSCSATCGGSGTDNDDDGNDDDNVGDGEWYLYQWSMQIGEVIATDVDDFQAFGCFFICAQSDLYVPQCPLGYCKNENCTQCYDWQ